MKASLWKEPFIHFVALGSLAFLAHAVFNREPAASNNAEIQVSQSNSELLRTRWRAATGNDPSPQQERALVDDFVKEEVFVREALALGLDRDDVIIRRRLASKFLALSNYHLQLKEPDDSQLNDWMANQADRFREPGRISFTHVFFSAELRGGRAEADAVAVLASFAQGDPPERAPDQGDRFMLHFDYAMKSHKELSELFGDAFVNDLAQAPLGSWSGPHASAYGVHLVRVSARKPGYLPPLAEIREQVLEAYLAEARTELEDALYRELRSRYRVILPDAAEDTP